MSQKINCKEFIEILKLQDFNFFTGVPDSLLKEFIYNVQRDRDLNHIISCNECESIALSIGYHLSTGKYGVVYLQNSGIGKIINPISSLCSKEVYSIPMLLIIGWRGCSDFEDEPQHLMMGKIMFSLLENLDIPYQILDGDRTELIDKIKGIKNFLKEHKTPYAIIVKKNSFLKDEIKFKKETLTGMMDGEAAVEIILDNIDKDIVISTTGKISREVCSYRVDKNQENKDFYVVGGMGCASSIANSISFNIKNKNIFILDGDGAVIMQMGALSTIGFYSSKNIHHIILDNGSYDSTGGQPTYSKGIDIGGIAKSCGYTNVKTVCGKKDLKNTIIRMRRASGPNMLIVKIKKGSSKNLIRPLFSPEENKNKFMRFLEDEGK